MRGAGRAAELHCTSMVYSSDRTTRRRRPRATPADRLRSPPAIAAGRPRYSTGFDARGRWGGRRGYPQAAFPDGQADTEGGLLTERRPDARWQAGPPSCPAPRSRRSRRCPSDPCGHARARTHTSKRPRAVTRLCSSHQSAHPLSTVSRASPPRSPHRAGPSDEECGPGAALGLAARCYRWAWSEPAAHIRVAANNLKACRTGADAGRI